MPNDLSAYALVAGVAGAVGGILQFLLNTYFARFVNSAQMKMELNKNDFYSGIPGPEGFKQTVRFRIWNENVYVAKNCRVFLTRLTEVGGRTRYYEIDETLQLPWEVEGQFKWMPIDLPKGASYNIVLLQSFMKHLSDERGELYPTSHSKELKTQRGIFDYKERIKFDTEFSIKLVATAENAEPYYMEASLLVPQDLLDGGPIRLWNIKGYYLSRIMTEIDESRTSWEKTKSLMKN